MQGSSDAPEYIDALARIGISSANEFESVIQQMERKPRDTVPNVPYLNIVSFSSLPPSLAPGLAANIKLVMDKVRKSDKPKATFREQRLFDDALWLSFALANTRTETAAGVLLQEREYATLPQVGPVAVPLLIAHIPGVPLLDERIALLMALHRLGTPEARAAVERGIPVILPAMLGDLKQPIAGEMEYVASRSVPVWPSLLRFETLGVLARDARPALLVMLRSSNVELHSKAARALASIHAFDTEPLLEAMLTKSRSANRAWKKEGDNDSLESRVLSEAIGTLQAAPEYYDRQSLERLQTLSLMPDAGSGVPNRAIDALGRRGAPALPALLNALTTWAARHKRSGSSMDNVAQDNVLPALAALGPAAGPAFPRLLGYLNDPDLGPLLGSNDSGFDIAHLGIRTPALKEQLFQQVMNNSNPQGRWFSARVLGEMGAIPGHMRGRLLVTLNSKEAWSYGNGPPRSLVFAITGRYPPPLFDSTPLFSITRLVHTFVQQRGCISIAAPAGPQDHCAALHRSGAAGVAALIPLLAHRQAEVRQAASDLLGSMGASAKAAVPAMLPQLRSSTALQRRVTAENLGRISQHDAAVPGLVPYLLHALHGSNDEERIAAAVQLGQFRHLPAHSVPALQRALKDVRLRDFQEPLIDAIVSTRSEEGVAALIVHLGSARSQSERDTLVAALTSSGAIGDNAASIRSAQTRDVDQLVSLAGVLTKRKLPRGETLLRRLLPAVHADLVAPDTAAVWNIEKRRLGARRLAALMRFSSKARAIGVREIDNIDPHIRTILIAALGDSAGPDVLPLLARVELNEDKAIAARAMDASDRIRTRHATPLQRWKQCIGTAYNWEDNIDRCRSM